MAQQAADVARVKILPPSEQNSDGSNTVSFAAIPSPIVFRGDATTAYRDPTAIYHDGWYRLFFTLVKIEPDNRPFSYCAWSKSRDLVHWSEPTIFTPREQSLNYGSPGNIIRQGDEWVLCLQTYPRPNGEKFGNDTARLWTMRSKDLENWGEPELIRVKGPQVPQEKMGRMIDPFLIEDKDEPGKWWCFYKVGMAWSRDLKVWTHAGRSPMGENPCVIVDGNEYVMFLSGGIIVKRSSDLKTWRDEGELTLGSKDWLWTKGRLTAAFVLDLRKQPGVGKALMFFHGSDYPESDRRGGFDNFASIGMAWSDDLKQWSWPQGQSVKDMQAKFSDPPSDCRPGTVWWWHGGAVTREGVVHELQLMKDAGIGYAGIVTMGYSIPNRPVVSGHEVSIPGSPEWTRHVAEAVQDAAKIGIRIDFTPTTSWPLSRQSVKDEQSAQILVRAHLDVPGGGRYSGPLPLPGQGMVKKLAWKEYLKKYRETIKHDPKLKLEALLLVQEGKPAQVLTSAVTGDGNSVAFDVPQGDCQLVAFWSFASMHFNAKCRVIDHCSREAVRGQMEAIARPVLNALPAALVGTTLAGLSLDNIEGFGEIWTPRFLQQFKATTGYDLQPWLPFLFPDDGDVNKGALQAAAKGKLSRIAYDYGSVLAEFYRDGCFEAMREWTNDNGLSLMAEGHQPAFCDHIDSNGAVDIPEMEVYKSKPVADRGLGSMRSAGHLYGRNILAAEAYTWQTPHFRGTLKELREASDELFSIGVNRINHHGWTYSPDGAGWPGWLFYASMNFNHRNSWFPLARGLTDYVARLSMVLRSGRPVVDIAFYGGSDPSLKSAGIVDGTRKQDRVSERALLSRSTVSEGRIIMGCGQYRLLILRSEAEEMPLELLEKLETLVKAGANVATLVLPERVPGFHDYQTKETALHTIVGRLFPKEQGETPRQVEKGRTWWLKPDQLPLVLHQLNVPPQVTGANVEFEHRKGTDFDTYFVFNPSTQALDRAIGFRAEGVAECWDAKTGAMTPLDFTGQAGMMTGPLQLPGRTGKLLVFRYGQALREKPSKQGESKLLAELTAPWTVEFHHADQRPVFTRTFDTLADWTSKEDLKYFSGMAVYQKTVSIPKLAPGHQLWVDLGDVKDAAKVDVNGQPVGIVFEPPYRLAIPSALLKAGENRISIGVCNVMENAVIPLLPNPGPGNLKWSRMFIKPEDLQVIGILHPSGLLGPVRLFEETQSNECQSRKDDVLLGQRK